MRIPPLADGPRVLMVTGGYPPEFAGGVRQCQELTVALRGAASFGVLTMTADRRLPAVGLVDGVPVHRILIDVNRLRSRVLALASLARCFRLLRRSFDIVHVHGYSQRVVPIALLSRLWGKRLMLTLQTGGHDDALEVKRRSKIEFWGYSQADLLTAVSPALEASCRAAGIPAEKVRIIPNSVDVRRYSPASEDERRAQREELGLPPQGKLILFVAAFFSADKCPDVLFEAWTRIAEERPSVLVFIGATRSDYFESDAALAERIRHRASELGLSSRLVFVEHAPAIERYYRASDVCVLPSIREGLSKTLLEAMATGLPSIATRLSGSTDWLIEDGVNGCLVPLRDPAALAAALRRVLSDDRLAAALGAAARRTVEAGFTSDQIAPQYLDAYHQLLGHPPITGVSIAPDVAAS